MGSVGFFECGLLMVLAMPLVLRWIPPNRFYGMRTRITLTRPDVWYPANAFAGRAIVIAAILSAVAFWLSPAGWLSSTWISNAILIGPLAAAIVLSYLRLRRF